MAPKRVPAVLSRCMDARHNVDTQSSKRIRAIYDYYGVDLTKDDCEGSLLAAIVLDRFSKAFEIRTPAPDRRLKVPDVKGLGEIVNALIVGSEAQLTPSSRKDVALRAKRWLSVRDLKPSQKTCCEALSKTDGPWRGLAPATLRDNLQRQPGARGRRLLRQQLKKVIAEIEANPGSEHEPFDD